MKSATPLREDLFRKTENGPTLLAGSCGNCGHTSYPKRPLCPNCGAEVTGVVELGSEGDLHSATTVQMGSQHFQPGYMVGYISMPGGIRVFSQITSPTGEVPPVGTRMRLELVPLWQDGETDVIGYRFTPKDLNGDSYA